MSIRNILPFSGVHDYDTGVSLVYNIYSAVEDVKVYQSQCRNVANRCASLMLSFQEKERGLDGQGGLTEVISLMTRINARLQSWATYSRTRAFIRQREIKEGIGDCRRDIEALTIQYSMALKEKLTGDISMDTIRQEDDVAMRVTMAEILRDPSELKEVLINQPPEQAETMVQMIKEEASEAGWQGVQDLEIQHGLQELQQFSAQLLSATDVSEARALGHDSSTAQQSAPSSRAASPSRSSPRLRAKANQHTVPRLDGLDTLPSPPSGVTPSTSHSSRSGDSLSLRRFPSLLSQYSHSQSSPSPSSVSSASSHLPRGRKTSYVDNTNPLPTADSRLSEFSTSSSDYSSLRSFTESPTSLRTTSRPTSPSDEQPKGLFRSLSRLKRSRSRSSRLSSSESVPPLPPLPLSSSQSDSESLRRHHRWGSSLSLSSVSSSGSSIPEIPHVPLAPNILLGIALTDTEAVLHRSRDGQVESGTLEGLVVRLFTETSQTSKDIRYRYVFLASYRLFTTSEQLFTILRKHFDAMDGEDGEDLAGTRYSILLLIKTWLQLGYEDMDGKVLISIGMFARTINESQTMIALAREICAIVNQKISNVDSPRPAPSLRISARVPLPKASDILPEELAVAFTILDGHLFSQITHFDCIAHLQQLSEVQRIQRCIITYNRIMNWVKKSILRPESVDARADVYKFFVNTAEECQKLQNFSSMAAILTALNSSHIKSLVLTREIRLVKAEKHMLHRMCDILDPTRSHRVYKGALRQHTQTVPWLAVHLQDLATVLSSSPSAVEVGGQALVNFARITKLTSSIRDVLQHNPPDLSSRRKENVLAYLETQLEAVPSDPMLDAFDKRSAILAAEEEKVRDQRLPELRALGFATTAVQPPRPGINRSSTAGLVV